METTQKIETARQKKESGDQAFKQGNTKDALKFYYEALMYLLGLDKNALQSVGMAPTPNKDDKQQEKTEIDEMIEKIYANMSACHLKSQNWRRARETADKALDKNPDNSKAMFRKGRALGEQGFFDKARKILEELMTKHPPDKELAQKEIDRLRIIDNEREKSHKQKMKGFLKKAAEKGNTLSIDGDVVKDEVQPAYIEDLKD